jgi:uncharacterized SAM-binding protein YcdF (DUF218 family)
MLLGARAGMGRQVSAPLAAARRRGNGASMIGSMLRSLTLLAEPLGLVWFCLLLVAVRLWFKSSRGLAVFVFLVAAFLSVVGSSRLPGDLVAMLERPFVIENLETVPVCDAVVALGGAVRPSRYEVFGVDMKDALDRVTMAVELARRGKAKNVVLGGAAHEVHGQRRIEADMTKLWLESWGVTTARIYSLGGCANTHEEAVRVAALRRELGWQRVILVTSAYHLKRARATFLTAGVPVVCVPCDFQTQVSVETEDEPVLLPIPRPYGFVKASLFLHEQIGWLSYRLRGWIQPSALADSTAALR